MASSFQHSLRTVSEESSFTEVLEGDPEWGRMKPSDLNICVHRPALIRSCWCVAYCLSPLQCSVSLRINEWMREDENRSLSVPWEYSWMKPCLGLHKFILLPGIRQLLRISNLQEFLLETQALSAVLWTFHSFHGSCWLTHSVDPAQASLYGGLSASLLSSPLTGWVGPDLHLAQLQAQLIYNEGASSLGPSDCSSLELDCVAKVSIGIIQGQVYHFLGR